MWGKTLRELGDGPVHGFNFLFFVLFLDLLTGTLAQINGIRPEAGDPDNVQIGDIPKLWSTDIICDPPRGRPNLPRWANPYPAPYNLRRHPFRTLTSLCSGNGNKVIPRRVGNQVLLDQRGQGNMGGFCNNIPLYSFDPEDGVFVGDENGQHGEMFVPEVFFFRSMAAPELYNNDALLLHCMAHCHCRQAGRRSGNEEDRDGWRRVRGGLDVKSIQNIVKVRSRSSPEREIVVTRPGASYSSHSEPINIPIPLNIYGSDDPPSLSSADFETCDINDRRSGRTCSSCKATSCISNQQCVSPSSVGCKCRVAGRERDSSGRFLAWCGISGLSGLANGRRSLDACACNSTYVSSGCCSSGSGLVWEPVEAKLGVIDWT